MLKILVFDDSNYGHHFFYNFNVMKALSKQFSVFYYTQLDDTEQKILVNKIGVKLINRKFKQYTNKLLANINDVWQLIRLLLFSMSVKVKLIHLVYFDRYYFSSLFCLPLVLLFSIGKGKLVLTCHQIPSRNVKLLSLKILLKLNLVHTVIVHGDFLLKILKQKVGDDNRIISLDYPARDSTEYSKAECFTKLRIKPVEQSVILYFGGTRYDKGIDILLDSLKDVAFDYLLVIAGTDDYFSRDFICNKIKENRLDPKKILMHFKYVEESDVDYYFSLADIVVLPYRKIFSGQSGPLTEGISHHCVVIGPNISQIGYTLDIEGNGITFEAEKVNDLSAKLNQCLENLNFVKNNLNSKHEIYKGRTSTIAFREKYRSLYDSII